MFTATRSQLTAALLTLAILGGTALAGCDASSSDASQGSAALASRAPEAGEVVPGRYIVTLRETPAALAAGRRLAPGAEAALEALATAPGVERKLTYRHALVGFSAELTEAAAATLRRDPRVASVEPVTIGTGASTAVTQEGATWGIDRSDQRALPVSGTYVYDRTGAGVTVYVIDSGMQTTHEQFGGRARLALNTDGTAVDFVGDGRDGADCYGHGTHVGASIGGSTYGIAKDVELVSVRVLRCDNTFLPDALIAAMDWVTANHPAGQQAIANMSLSAGNNSAVEAAARTMIAAGIQIVAAAANQDGDACRRTPARVPEVVTVGATSANDARASFSNWGTCLDLFAPGDGVISADIGADDATRIRSGTSMATAHTSGVAALYLEANPTMTPAQLHQALIDLSTKNVVTSAGRGSPNRLLFTDAPQPPSPPVASFTASCNRLVCTFTNTSTGATSYAWTFGDGSASTATSPTHTYGAAGTYTVTLTATGAGGTSSSSTTVRPKR